MVKLNDPIAFRKMVAGLSLIGFSIAGLASTLIAPATDTSDAPATLYAEVVGHENALFVSGVLFVISSILLVPAAIGIVHLLPSRGVVVGHIGGAFALLGAAGHMGLSTYYLMLARVPHEGDRAAMMAYLDRTTVVVNLLLPLLIAVPVGLLLLTIGLVRARFASGWLVVLIVWALMVVVFGYLGVRVLRLSRVRWAEPHTA